MSIPEQQPTIAFTKDLSLPINFLLGEDDVKLKEGKIIEISIINSMFISLRCNLSWS
jgi:hypothetical protein